MNTIREMQQWKWRRDERLGVYVDEPVPYMDDAMAALRYAIETVRRGQRKARIQDAQKYGIW